MNEIELRQLFKNLSDCYADTWDWDNMGEPIQGEVKQAMTEDRFIEALKEAKLLPIPAIIKSACECGNDKGCIDKTDGFDYGVVACPLCD